jgi:hypothetical protein
MGILLERPCKRIPRVRRLLTVILLLVVVGVPASVVMAATPKKGNAYVGTLAGTLSRVEKRVVLKVFAAGDTGRVGLECSGTRFGVSSRFEIAASGKFTALKKAGSVQVWRLRARFVSSQTAKAKLYLPATCDGKGGKVTLQLAE